MLPSTLYIITVTYALANFEVATSNAIYKKIHYLTFDLDGKVTQNIAQYHLHHVTYAPAEFEVAMSNGLGGDAFTRKYTNWSMTIEV